MDDIDVLLAKNALRLYREAKQSGEILPDSIRHVAESQIKPSARMQGTLATATKGVYGDPSPEQRVYGNLQGAIQAGNIADFITASGPAIQHEQKKFGDYTLLGSRLLGRGAQFLGTDMRNALGASGAADASKQERSEPGEDFFGSPKLSDFDQKYRNYLATLPVDQQRSLYAAMNQIKPGAGDAPQLAFEREKAAKDSGFLGQAKYGADNILDSMSKDPLQIAMMAGGPIGAIGKAAAASKGILPASNLYKLPAALNVAKSAAGIGASGYFGAQGAKGAWDALLSDMPGEAVPHAAMGALGFLGLKHGIAELPDVLGKSKAFWNAKNPGINTSPISGANGPISGGAPYFRDANVPPEARPGGGFSDVAPEAQRLIAGSTEAPRINKRLPRGAPEPLALPPGEAEAQLARDNAPRIVDPNAPPLALPPGPPVDFTIYDPSVPHGTDIGSVQGSLQPQVDPIAPPEAGTQTAPPATLPMGIKPSNAGPDAPMTQGVGTRVEPANGYPIMRTPDQFPVNYHTEIWDAHDLNISHDPWNWQERPEYPSDYQPKDRNEVKRRLQVEQISNQPNADQTYHSPSTTAGGPIAIMVDGKPLVLDHNGITMGLQKGYDRASINGDHSVMDGYKQGLKAEIARTGGDPSAVDNHHYASSVNIVDGYKGKPASEFTQADILGLVNDLAEHVGAGTDAAEKSLRDGKALLNMPSAQNISTNAKGDLNVASSSDFVKEFTASLGSNSAGSMVDAGDSLSQAGHERLQNAILGAAYNDPALINRLVASRNSPVKGVDSALEQAAPSFIRVKQAIDRGELPPEYDLSDVVAKASNLYADLKGRDANLGETYMAQEALFTDAVTEKTFVKTFDLLKNSYLKIRDMLNDINEKNIEQGVSLFASGGEFSPAEIARGAVDKALEGIEIAKQTNKRDTANAGAVAKRPDTGPVANAAGPDTASTAGAVANASGSARPRKGSAGSPTTQYTTRGKTGTKRKADASGPDATPEESVVWNVIDKAAAWLKENGGDSAGVFGGKTTSDLLGGKRDWSSIFKRKVDPDAPAKVNQFKGGRYRNMKALSNELNDLMHAASAARTGSKAVADVYYRMVTKGLTKSEASQVYPAILRTQLKDMEANGTTVNHSMMGDEEYYAAMANPKIVEAIDRFYDDVVPDITKLRQQTNSKLALKHVPWNDMTGPSRDNYWAPIKAVDAEGGVQHSGLNTSKAKPKVTSGSRQRSGDAAEYHEDLRTVLEKVLGEDMPKASLQEIYRYLLDADLAVPDKKGVPRPDNIEGHNVSLHDTRSSGVDSSGADLLDYNSPLMQDKQGPLIIDQRGKPELDAQGKKQYVPLLDADGNPEQDPKLDKDGKQMYQKVERMWVPHKVGKELQLLADPPEQDAGALGIARSAMRQSVGANLFANPAEITGHVHRQLSAVSKVPPAVHPLVELVEGLVPAGPRIGTALRATVANKSELSGMAGVKDMLSGEAFWTPKRRAMQLQNAIDNAGSERGFSDYLAKEGGVDFLKLKSFQHWQHSVVFGPNGWDARMRILLEEARAKAEGNNDAQRRRDVSKMIGDYTSNPDAAIRILKHVDPYVATQLAMKWTELKQLFGNSGLKGKNTGQAAGLAARTLVRGTMNWIWTLVAAGLVTGAGTIINGPNDKERLKHIFDADTGTKDKGKRVYVGASKIEPGSARAARMLDIQEIADAIHNDKRHNPYDAAGAAILKGGANKLLETIDSPLLNAVWATATGQAPYLNARGEEMRVVPKPGSKASHGVVLDRAQAGFDAMFPQVQKAVDGYKAVTNQKEVGANTYRNLGNEYTSGKLLELLFGKTLKK